MRSSRGTGDPGGEPSSVPSSAWKSAYGVVVAMVATIPLGIGFFLYEGVYGPLSDVDAFFVGLFLAPLVWSAYLLDDRTAADRLVLGVGVVAVAGICIGSLGLVVVYVLSLPSETFGSPFLGVQFLGWFLLGFWLFGVGWLGRRTAAVGDRTPWAAITAGIGTAGGMIALVYSYAVGSFTLLFPLFMTVFLVAFLSWALLFARDLRRDVAGAETSNPTTSG